LTRVRGLLPRERFSHASRLSVRTLRRYDADGLLPPERVEADTGRQYYAPEQLADARVIRWLRELDVPLAQIRRILTGRDLELLRRVVIDDSAGGSVETARQESVVTELGRLLASRDSPGDAEVRLKDLPVQRVVSIRTRTTLRGLPVVFAAAVGRLDRVLRDAPGRRVGPTVALHHGEDFDPEDVDIEIAVPIEGTVPTPRGMGISQVEATMAAVTVHVGPYDSLDEGYRTLAVWVCANGYELDGGPRETYLFGPDRSGPDQFRTEVAWPVKDL
jgi:DNA-binding transcriptional MerR regulator